MQWQNIIVDWKKVAEHVPGKTHLQCLQRWKKVLQPGLKKGAWTKEEDEALLASVKSLGDYPAWVKVAESVPGRSPKQCRERWHLNLDPSIQDPSVVPWTNEEDEMIIALQRKMGNQWANISGELKLEIGLHRTENAVKNRFKSLQRLREKMWTEKEDDFLILSKRFYNHRYLHISEAMPRRSKNAVRKRWKQLCDLHPKLETLPNQTEIAQIQHISLENYFKNDENDKSNKSNTVDLLNKYDNTVMAPPLQQQQVHHHQQQFQSPPSNQQSMPSYKNENEAMSNLFSYPVQVPQEVQQQQQQQQREFIIKNENYYLQQQQQQELGGHSNQIYTNQMLPAENLNLVTENLNMVRKASHESPKELYNNLYIHYDEKYDGVNKVKPQKPFDSRAPLSTCKLNNFSQRPIENNEELYDLSTLLNNTTPGNMHLPQQQQRPTLTKYDTTNTSKNGSLRDFLNTLNSDYDFITEPMNVAQQ